MDSGNQGTYVSSHTRDITTFQAGNRASTYKDLEDKTPSAMLLRKVLLVERESLTFTALVVPFICNPLTAQLIDLPRNCDEHFTIWI